MKKVICFMSMFLFIGMATANVALADAQWTFMVYLDGDNNLESAGIDDFLEMSSVGSDLNVNIVVQFDRIDGYDSSYDDWKTCKRFLITSGMTPTTANAIADIGEANMGDPATLTAFIDWATTAYPASRYALVLWNHGGGWREQAEALIKAIEAAKTCEGKNEIERALKEIKRPNYKAVCWDDTDGDCLYMKEVKSAINAATYDMHMIGFDACFMGMIEVAYEIKDTGAGVVVGSEETEPGDGWPYDTILGDLISNPSWTPAQLGTAIVNRYYASYGNSETQSAIDLTQMNNLASTVSNFADKMRTSWNTDKSAVQTAAQAVMDGIYTAVIHDQHGSSYPGAHGLAIYFPDNSGDFDSDYNGTVIDFPADTLWEEFLSEFYASMGGSWIELARWNSQEFYYPEHIDLYDFCENIVNSPTGDLVLSEGFEGGAVPPEGWTLDVTNPDYTWKISYDSHSGTYAADVVYDPALTPQDEVLLTSELPAMTSATLEFWSFGSIYWGITPYDNYDLEVWMVVGDWDAGTGDDIFLAKADDDWVSSWEWSLTSIDLSSYLPAAQPVRIGFRYKGVDGAQAGLDDIKIWGNTNNPEINVRKGATNIPDNTGSYDFGSVKIGSSAQATFTIENSGTANLNLTGNPLVQLVGSDEFQVTQQPTTPVSAGSSVAFSITFTPTQTATTSINTVSIDNNDSDENPYNFSIRGTRTNEVTVTSIATIHGALYSYQVAISPDGGYVLVGDEYQNVVTFAESDGDVLWQYSLPADVEMEDGAISMNGNLVVVGGQGGSVFGLSKGGTLLWEVQEPRGECEVALTEAGDKIFTESGGTLYCYDGDANKLWEKPIDTRGWTIWRISTTSNGDKVLLKTNSDIILCDGLGNEIGFFDIVEGNSLRDADISPDGNHFVAQYHDKDDKYYVALYSVSTGELWRKEISNNGGVRLDSQGHVFATCRGGNNYLWDSAGILLASWPNGGNNIDVDNVGAYCIVGNFSEAKVYKVTGVGHNNKAMPWIPLLLLGK